MANIPWQALWLLCVSIRWGQRSSRSGCWGSGWTAVLRRVGFWWPCRRARGGGTTLLSLKWWRSGWTVIGSLPLVQLFLMERKKRRTKTSKRTNERMNSWHHLTLQHGPLAFPHIRKHTNTHLYSPNRATNPRFPFRFLSLIRQIIWVCCKIKECNHDCICLYRVCSLLLFVFCF